MNSFHSLSELDKAIAAAKAALDRLQTQLAKGAVSPQQAEDVWRREVELHDLLTKRAAMVKRQER